MSEQIKRIFVFDFDGTLSEIVPQKGTAELHVENRRLLQELAEMKGTITAVLSSRTLDDIISRIDIPGIFIGGGSGLVWLLPGKGKSAVPEEIRVEVYRTRSKTVDLIRSLETCKGIAIEDKFWSVAVHTRGAPEISRQFVERFLRDCAPVRKLRSFRGPEVIDIFMVSDMDKSAGVRRLCNLAGVDPGTVQIIYAGDDENDARAMAWVLDNGGLAISVGTRPLTPGSRVVSEPGLLAGEVRKILAKLPDTAESRL